MVKAWRNESSVEEGDSGVAILYIAVAIFIMESGIPNIASLNIFILFLPQIFTVKIY